MSMLAERRRKQKWAVDPRNTAWSNDDSKFGQRMLEKMGWSKGKGLGAQEQGATEHIKVQVKNNHLGLGASINNEDNWIAHQDDFNQLLAALNTCHGQEAADASDKEKKSFSLEEKSKISKNRVHYKKFTKGKDLSSRSRTDLDCIFGKRQSKKTAQKRPQAPASGVPACQYKQDACGPTTVDSTEASTTTTSAFTIQEYFAKRMAQLKNKPQVPAPRHDLPETPGEWKKGKKRNKGAAVNSVEDCPQPKAKRSKKKRQEEEEGQGPVANKGDQAENPPRSPQRDECSDVPVEAAGSCVQLLDDQDDAPKPKKRKDKKKIQNSELAVDTALDKAPVVKKKKKKKKKKKASR